jgi:hypothetical protein
LSSIFLKFPPRTVFSHFVKNFIPENLVENHNKLQLELSAQADIIPGPDEYRCTHMSKLRVNHYPTVTAMCYRGNGTGQRAETQIMLLLIQIPW